MMRPEYYILLVDEWALVYRRGYYSVVLLFTLAGNSLVTQDDSGDLQLFTFHSQQYPD